MTQPSIETIAKEVGVFALGEVVDSLFGDNKAKGDLNKFLSLIKQSGVASPAKFRVDIVPPKGLSKFSGYGETLSLLCDAAAIPSLNILTQEAITYGPGKAIPYNVAYGHMMCSFIVEQDMAVKQFFDAWFRVISDPVTFNLNFSDEYVTKIIINQLDKNMKVVYSVHLYRAFPTSMNQMNLNYRHSGDTHRLEIGFMYKNWIPSGDKFVNRNISSTGVPGFQETQTFAYKFPSALGADTPI